MFTLLESPKPFLGWRAVEVGSTDSIETAAKFLHANGPDLDIEFAVEKSDGGIVTDPESLAVPEIMSELRQLP